MQVACQVFKSLMRQRNMSSANRMFRDMWRNQSEKCKISATFREKQMDESLSLQLWRAVGRNDELQPALEAALAIVRPRLPVRLAAIRYLVPQHRLWETVAIAGDGSTDEFAGVDRVAEGGEPNLPPTLRRERIVAGRGARNLACAPRRDPARGAGAAGAGRDPGRAAPDRRAPARRPEHTGADPGRARHRPRAGRAARIRAAALHTGA